MNPPAPAVEAEVGSRRATAATTFAAEGRLTLDGSDELEQRLRSLCARVLHEVSGVVSRGQFEALLLGGGYGRGEGGVLRTQTGDEPYNDLEFYLCIRGNRFLNRRCYGGRISQLAHQLSEAAGIEVEFKIISLAHLRNSPPSMFYYDLVMGHQWVKGDESLLDGCEHHRQAGHLPMAEATRLLMNRGTGLLLAGERLKKASLDADDVDFIARNLAKAQLAFGDALLAALGQYHWSCRERHRRLRALVGIPDYSSFADICAHHGDGVEFKLHPVRSNLTSDELAVRHQHLLCLGLKTWLFIENQRLKRTFPTARAYALDRAAKCPETNSSRNRLINCRLFGIREGLSGNGWRHPRERLLNALPLLLWEDPDRDRELKDALRECLRTNATTRAALVEDYLRLWEQAR